MQVGRESLIALLTTKAHAFYGQDVTAPLAYEPSGADFFSPALAEADLLRRILPQAAFVRWLTGFLGTDAATTLPHRLTPVQLVDASDGQLAHFCGLNLSRAWMLAGIAAALPVDMPLYPALQELAAHHRAVGLVDALHADYMVAHWAPTFVLYLLTERGMTTA